MQKRKRRTGLIIVLSIIAVLIITVVCAVGIYSRFGGFGTGDCADTEEFKKYATNVSALTVPDEAQIVALGEATHGNKEFQQLRLDVLQILVEQYGVRAFAIEGDFGGCEAVNRYIHGGSGTAAQAVAAIGFAIYRTEETERLVEWMRDYNAFAAQGEDIRFYGFDIQQRAHSYNYLLEALRDDGIDTSELEQIWDSENDTYKAAYSAEQRSEIIVRLKAQLPTDDEQAIHFADALLQNIELGRYADDAGELNAHRDGMMAENTMWILHREQERGHGRIMISGHNNHIMQRENSDTPVLGSLLAEKLSGGYFAIGTDFYKSSCNLPKPYTGERITHTFYSHDPLAKASKKCGFDSSFIDFSDVPETSALTAYIENSVQMGSLGELYSILMNFLPRSYRVARAPKQAYDAMIFVTNAAPIEIEPLNK